MIKFALTVTLPTPSLVPGAAQSASVVTPHVGSTSGAPMMRMPPPFVGIVGFVAWLNSTELCSISPLKLKPS
jgi:hypothetical protein